MTDKKPNSRASSKSIRFTTEVRPVTDDLAGLRSRRPEAPTMQESYALYSTQAPILLDGAARRQRHAAEIARFFKLAKRDHLFAEAHMQSARTLSHLITAAALAVAVTPARSADDLWVKANIGNVLKHRAAKLGQKAMAALMPIAFGPHAGGYARETGSAVASLDDIASSMDDMQRRMTAMSIGVETGLEAVSGVPAAHSLEQAASLEAFASPALAAIASDAISALHLADEWSPGSSARQEVVAAHQSALTLGYAAIAEVGLAPARDADDLSIKQAIRKYVMLRSRDPKHLRATAVIAFNEGNVAATWTPGSRFETGNQIPLFAELC